MIHAHASHIVKFKIRKETVKLGVGLLRWSRVPAEEKLGYKMIKGENLVYMLHKRYEIIKLLYFIVFKAEVHNVYSPGCTGTHYADQPSLKLTKIFLL